MKLEIQKILVGRQMGFSIEDYKKVQGYSISISFGGNAWMTLGINEGFTMAEIKQLRDALNNLDIK